MPDCPSNALQQRVRLLFKALHLRKTPFRQFWGSFRTMHKLARMSSKLHQGQSLEGQKNLYRVIRPLSQKKENLWLASDPNSRMVLVKIAAPTQLENEIEASRLCRGHKSIRQLVDVVENPQSLILEYKDKSLYEASCEENLDRYDVKRAVKAALNGLAVLHAHKRAHTDIKPNNILANNGTGDLRFDSIQLGDFGDSVPEDIATNNGEHIIGAPIYRAPEVMLNARWTIAVDIWSLGATAICYLLRRHLFVPDDIEPEDERFALAVLMLQNKYFGPFPAKFFQLLDDEGRAALCTVQQLCSDETGAFGKAGPGTIDSEDKDFILYLMQPDPRDRPSAADALMHRWLNGV